jgi:hypothetical protein
MEAFLASAGIVALAKIGDEPRHIPFAHAAKFRNAVPDLDRHSRHSVDEPVASRRAGISEANP